MEIIHNRLALTAVAGAVGAMLLSGCVDDSYDLENIDTTSRIEVKDLTLPLNLTPVLLDDLVDLSSEDCIDTINGQYVLIKLGTFNSNPIEIQAISATPTPVEPIPAGEDLPIFGGVPVDIKPYEYRFNYTYYGVDKYIVDLESATVDFDMEVTITAKNSTGNGIPSTFSNLSFRVPAGLYGRGYCKINDDSIPSSVEYIGPGDEPVITFDNPDGYVADNGVFTCTYHVERFDKAAADASIELNPATGDRTFKYPGSISFLGGQVQANSGNGETTGHVEVAFNLNTLLVKSFTGTVSYELQNLNAKDVVLDSLPDVLSQNANIIMSNPQIYLSVENPLAKYGVEGAAGLKITPNRNNTPGPGNIAYMPTDIVIKGVAGKQNFCLTPDPDNVTSFYEEFADPTPVKYTMKNLGQVLAGNGLPQSLNIEFENPRMLQTRVSDFTLGTQLGAVSGNYTFYAPLQFGKGTEVIYTDTQKGWDLGSDLEISELTINAHVVSDIPVTVKLTADAIDDRGNDISGVSVDTVTVKPGESDVKIHMTGSIRNLDGIRYTVTLLAENDAAILNKTMGLKLTDIKVIVSGYYESSDNDDDDDDDEVYPDFNNY